jgi:hypothetical protein
MFTARGCAVRLGGVLGAGLEALILHVTGLLLQSRLFAVRSVRFGRRAHASGQQTAHCQAKKKSDLLHDHLPKQSNWTVHASHVALQIWTARKATTTVRWPAVMYAARYTLSIDVLAGAHRVRSFKHREYPLISRNWASLAVRAFGFARASPPPPVRPARRRGMNAGPQREAAISHRAHAAL